MLETVELSRVTPGSAAHLKCLAQVMALTNEARRDGYDKRLYEPGVAEQFLAASHLHPYRGRMMKVANKLGSTTQVSAIDADGNAASVTTSNGEGSSYIIPGTAIMLNNMLGEEDLHPHGFHQWVPDQRISSMMAPTIVLKEGKAELVLGSGGSNRIRTAILQVISNVLDFGMPIAEAITAPRIHWERGTLHSEPGYETAALEQAQTADTQAFLAWQQQNMFFGGVHAVACDGAGELHGAGDPRRGGAVAIA
jgi:gamma-glutamyltranspeptidase/glutathione hydrolase